MEAGQCVRSSEGPGPAVTSATVWGGGCCILKERMNVRCFEGSMDEMG